MPPSKAAFPAARAALPAASQPTSQAAPARLDHQTLLASPAASTCLPLLPLCVSHVRVDWSPEPKLSQTCLQPGTATHAGAARLFVLPASQPPYHTLFVALQPYAAQVPMLLHPLFSALHLFRPSRLACGSTVARLCAPFIHSLAHCQAAYPNCSFHSCLQTVLSHACLFAATSVSPQAHLCPCCNGVAGSCCAGSTSCHPFSTQLLQPLPWDAAASCCPPGHAVSQPSPVGRLPATRRQPLCL